MKKKKKYRQTENGTYEGSLVVTGQFGQGRLQNRDQFVDHSLGHSSRCFFYQIIDFRVILVLKIKIEV